MACQAGLRVLVLCLSLVHAEEIRWNNANGGNWNTPTNWDLARVPQTTDDVIVDIAGSFTINVVGQAYASSVTIPHQRANNGSDLITLYIQGSANLDIQQTLVADDVTMNPHSVLTARDGAEIRGTFNWHGGTLSGDRSSKYDIYGALDAAFTSYPRNGYISTPTLVIHNQATFSSGTIRITQGGELIVDEGAIFSMDGAVNIYDTTGYVYNYGTMNIHSTQTITISTDFFTSGMLQLAGGQLRIYLSTITGDVVFGSDSSLSFYYGSGFRHYVAESASLLGDVAIVCSAGTSTIESGNMALQSLSLSSSCILELTERVNLLQSIDSVRVLGSSKLSFATFDYNRVQIEFLRVEYRAVCEIFAPADIARLEQDMDSYRYGRSSKLALANNSAITERWSYAGGELDVSGSMLVENECYWTGGLLKTITNGDITIKKTCEWIQTDVASLTSHAKLLVDSGGAIEVKTSSTINGGGRIHNYGSFQVNLLPPSLFTIENIQFVNEGQFHMDSAPPSTLNIAAEVINTGRVTVAESNTVRFQTGCDYNDYETGSIEINDGTVVVSGGEVRPFITSHDTLIKVESGTFNLKHSDENGQLEISGGTLYIEKQEIVVRYNSLTCTGGELFLSGHLRLDRFTMTGGVISGPGSLIVDDEWLWEEGEISRSQLGNITVKGNFQAQSTAPKILGKSLYILGKSTWVDVGLAVNILSKLSIGAGVTLDIFSNSMYFYSNGVVENHGIVNITLIDGSCVFDAVLDNYGTVLVHGGQLILRNSVVYRRGSRLVLGSQCELLLIQSEHILSTEFIETLNGTLKISQADVVMHNDIGVKQLVVHHSIVNLKLIQGVTLDSLTVADNDVWTRYAYDNSIIRLVGSSLPNEGRVEVWYRGQWGTVCDDGFDTNAAKVVCRQLGYSGGSVYNAWRYGSGPIFIRYPRCTGEEFNIADCPGTEWGVTPGCGHYEDAGVRCVTDATSGDTIMTFASVTVGGWTHVIGTLLVEDTATLRFNAPSTIETLILKKQSTIENNYLMVINGKLEWISGSLVGISQQGTVRVKGHADLFQQDSSQLSRQTLILESTAVIAWTVGIQVMHGGILDVAQSAHVSVISQSGGFTQGSALSGALYIRGQLQINGSLSVAADLFIEGTVHVKEKAALLLNECRIEKSGVDYKGTLSTTVSNRICQRWDSQTPHSHSITSDQLPDNSLREAANYCRNPAGLAEPWCYTTYRYSRYEFCSIPYCGSVHISGTLIIDDLGIIELGSPATFESTASIHGSGLSFEAGTHEFSGASTSTKLLASGSKLTVNEKNAIDFVEEIIVDRQGFCTIECREIACERLDVSIATVNTGTLEVNRDIIFHTFKLRKGTLKTQLSISIGSLDWTEGNIECVAGQTITIEQLRIRGIRPKTIQNCQIVIASTMVVEVGASFQMDNAQLVISSGASLTMQGNTGMSCINSFVQILGQWRIENSFGSVVGQTSVSCPLENQGSLEVFNTILRLQGNFHHSGTLNTDTQTQLHLDAELNVESNSHLNIVGEMHVNLAKVELDTFSGFIQSLWCKSDCILNDFALSQVGSLRITSGTTRVFQSSVEVPKILVEGGDLYLLGPVRVGQMDIESGTVNIHELVEVEMLTWIAGTIRGSSALTAKHVDLRYGIAQEIYDVEFTLAGAIQWERDFVHTITLGGTAVLRNAAGNTLECYGYMEITGAQQQFENLGTIVVKESSELIINVPSSSTGTIRAEQSSALHFKQPTDLFGTLETTGIASVYVNDITAHPLSKIDLTPELNIAGSAKFLSPALKAPRVIVESGDTTLHIPQDRNNFQVDDLSVNGGSLQLAGNGAQLDFGTVSIQDGSMYIRHECNINHVKLTRGTLRIDSPSTFGKLDFKAGALESGLDHTGVVVGELILYDLGTKAFSAVHISVELTLKWNDPGEHTDAITIQNNAHMIILPTATMSMVTERHIFSQEGGKLTNMGLVLFDAAVSNIFNVFNVHVDLVDEGTINMEQVNELSLYGYFSSQNTVRLHPGGNIYFHADTDGDPVTILSNSLRVTSSQVHIRDTSSFDEIIVESDASLSIHTNGNSLYHIPNVELRGKIYSMVDMAITTLTLDGGSLITLSGLDGDLSVDQLLLGGNSEIINTDMMVTQKMYAYGNRLQISQCAVEVSSLAEFSSSFQINLNTAASYTIASSSHHIFASDVSIGSVDGSDCNLIIDGNMTVKFDFTSTVNTFQRGVVLLEGAVSTATFEHANSTTSIAGVYKTSNDGNSLVFTGPGKTALKTASDLFEGSKLIVQGGVVSVDLTDVPSALEAELIIQDGSLEIVNPNPTRSLPIGSVTIQDAPSSTVSVVGPVAFLNLVVHEGSLTGEDIVIGNMTFHGGRVASPNVVASSMYVFGDVVLDTGSTTVNDLLVAEKRTSIFIENGATLLIASSGKLEMKGANDIQTNSFGTLSVNGEMEIQPHSSVSIHTNMTTAPSSSLSIQKQSTLLCNAVNDFSGTLNMMSGSMTIFSSSSQSTFPSQASIRATSGEWNVQSGATVSSAVSNLAVGIIRVVGNMIATADSCHGLIQIEGGSLTLEQQHSLSHLIMVSGSMTTTQRTAVNGPAILTAGTINVEAGATLYFNGQVDKLGVVENSAGTISYVDAAESCFTRTTCSACTASCDWKEASSTCVLDSRQGRSACFGGTCTDGCGVIRDDKLCRLTSACQWCALSGCTDVSVPCSNVPANHVFWANAAGGSWNSVSNWAGGAIPTENDTVIINIAGRFTVYTQSDVTIKSVVIGRECNQELCLSSPKLQLNNGLVVNGDIFVHPSATLEARGYNRQLVINGQFENDGTLVVFDYTTVSGTGEITNNGLFTSYGFQRSYGDLVINLNTTNNGLIDTFSSRWFIDVHFCPDCVLQNTNAGTFAFSGNSRIFGGTINNTGILLVVETGVHTMSTAILNYGLISVNQGSFSHTGTIMNHGIVTVHSSMGTSGFSSSSAGALLRGNYVSLNQGNHEFSTGLVDVDTLIVQASSVMLISTESVFQHIQLNGGSFNLQRNTHVKRLDIQYGTVTGNNNSLEVDKMLFDWTNYRDTRMYSTNVVVKHFMRLHQYRLYMYASTNITTLVGSTVYIGESVTSLIQIQDSSQCTFSHEGIMTINGILTMNNPFISSGQINVIGGGSLALNRDTRITIGSVFVGRNSILRFDYTQSASMFTEGAMVRVDGHLYTQSSVLLDDAQIQGAINKLTVRGSSGHLRATGNITDLTHINELVLTGNGQLTIDEHPDQRSLHVDVLSVSQGHVRINRDTTIRKAVLDDYYSYKYIYLHENYTYGITEHLHLGRYTQIVGTDADQCVLYVHGTMSSSGNTINVISATISIYNRFDVTGTSMTLSSGSVLRIRPSARMVMKTSTISKSGAGTIRNEGRIKILYSTSQSQLYASVHNSGEMQIHSNLNLYGDSSSHGIVILQEGAQLTIQNGPHEFNPDSTLQCDPGTTFSANTGQTVINGTLGTLDHVVASGRLDIISEEPSTHIRSIYVGDWYQAGFYFTGNELIIDTIVLRGGVTEFYSSAVTTNRMTSTNNYQTFLRGARVTVMNRLDISVSRYNLYIGTVLEIAAGAIFRTSGNVVLNQDSSSTHNNLLINKGKMIVNPGQILDIRPPFESYGSLELAGEVRLYSHPAEFHGDIKMRTGSLMRQYDGHLEVSENATLSGDCTLGLYTDTSNIYAKAAVSETQLTLVVIRGTHTLTTDPTAPTLHIQGRGDHSHYLYHGYITIAGSDGVCDIESIDLESYTHIIAMESNRLQVGSLKMNGDNYVEGPGVVVTQTLEWIRGTISSGADVTVAGVTKVSSTGAHNLYESNLTTTGPVHVSSETTCTKLSLRDAIWWVMSQSEILIENCFEIDSVDVNKRADVRNEGTITLSGTGSVLHSDAHIINDGIIGANTNSMFLHALTNNGHIRHPGEITLGGQQSVFSDRSTYEFSAEKSTLVVEGNAEVIGHASNMMFTLVGISGRFIVPDGISWQTAVVVVGAGFTLQIDGILRVDALFLEGGTIDGAGSLIVTAMQWTAGELAVNSSICTHSLISSSPSEKLLTGGTLNIIGDASVYDGVTLTMSMGAILYNSASLKLFPNTNVQSTDAQSVLFNEGTIEMKGGTLAASARLHSGLQNEGTIHVVSGFAEFGNQNFVSNYNGTVYVSPGTRLIFSGGNHTFEADSEFEGTGLVQVNDQAAEILVEDGEGMFLLTSVEVLAGTFRNRREQSQALRYVRVAAGTYIAENHCVIDVCSLVAGQLIVRTQIGVGSLYLEYGDIVSDRRQSQVSINNTQWIAGTFRATDGKRLMVDTERLTVTAGAAKEAQGTVILTVKKSAIFASRLPIHLSESAQIVVDVDAIFIVVGGEVVQSSPSDGMFVNDGTIEIGLVETTSSKAAFGSPLQNNGQIIVKNVDLTLSNGGDLGDSGVYFQTGSTLEVLSGSLIISPGALEYPTNIMLEGGSLILTIGSYELKHEITVTAGQLLFNPDADEDDFEVIFPGTISITGGNLNVTGETELSGDITFYKGSIIGNGMMTITENATLSILYSDSISDSRNINIDLLSCEGSCEVLSPVVIGEGSVFKIAEGTTLQMRAYTSFTGRGQILNMGTINVAVHPDFLSLISLNLHNYWTITTEQGRLFLQALSPSVISLHDSSQLSSPGTILGDRVQSGGILDSTFVIDGDMTIHGPTYITGIGTWRSGQLSHSSNPCNANYNPPSSVIVPPCLRQFLLVQGSLIIQNEAYDKTIADNMRLVNEGTITWTSGKLRVGTTAVINNGVFTVNATTTALLWERLVYYRPSYLTNNGAINVIGTSATLQAAVTSTGQLDIASGCHLSVESLTQSMDDAILAGEDATLAGPISIYGGTMEWRGSITGHLNINSAKLLSRGAITVDGNFGLGSESYVEINIHGPSTYDSITVTGSVTFAGRLLVDWNSYNPDPSTVFDVIMWSGSSSGQFSEVVSSNSVPIAAVYNGNALQISVL